MSDLPSEPFWQRVPILSAYTAAIVVGGLAQLALGADADVVGMAEGAALISVIPAFVFGVRDLPALIALSAGARFAASAIYWRLLVGRRIDIDLNDPHESFYVILCGVSAIALAVLVAHLIFNRRPLFREQYAAPGMQILVVLGALITLLGLVAASIKVGIAGGIGALSATGTTLLPVALMGNNLARGRPALTPGLWGIVLFLCILGVAVNSRQGVLQPLTAVFFFVLCFHVPVSRRAIVAAALGGFVFIAVISPVMIDVRSARNYATPDQMIGLTLAALDSGEVRATAEELDRARELFGGSYAMQYTNGGGEVVQRMVNVEQMDIVVDRAHRFGQIGTARFWRGVVELLPSFMVSDKSVIRTPSYALWVYGVQYWGTESNSTLTPFGDAYAYGGIEFVIFSMFVIYLIVFLLFRIFCPKLEDSLFAVFIVASYIHLMTEQTTVGVLAMPLREFPFELAIFWTVTKVRHPLFALFGPSVPGG
jgi:hypothetical protein